MHDPKSNWEAVIGLEIHVELNTQSKLFSTAHNRFACPPNTNITEVCTGQPGALPVLNKEAVKKAIQIGLALNSEINLCSKFDRKSYFYPDSPRNFQITQYDEPILIGGFVQCEVEDKEMIFQIARAHLEDDAGMLKHFPNHTLVDYNRAGVPLLEIVSEPCLHTPYQASCYARTIRSIIQYVGASDCNMQEGSLRFDANVSVRKKGEEGFRNKTEIKNMNSFRNMEQALTKEIERQVGIYLEHPEKASETLIQQATFRWDADRQQAILMRKKEYDQDYRYFPEPDLPPLVLTKQTIESLRLSLPELPLQRKRRYMQDYQLKKESADLLTQEKRLSDYFEEGLQYTSQAKSLCNWILVEFGGKLDKQKHLEDVGICAKDVAQLVNMIHKGKINGKIAKKVAEDMLKNPHQSPEKIVEANPNYQPLNQRKDIEEFVDLAIKENEKSVCDYKAGKEKALSHLMGKVMQKSKGKASPAIVEALLKEKLK